MSPKTDIPSQWSFRHQSIADTFDTHVREQLPWYDVATNAVATIAENYLPSEGGVLLDVGASTGNIGRALSPVITARNTTLIAYEAAPQMASKYNGGGELIVGDVQRQSIPVHDVSILFLVVMFLPTATRQQFLKRVYRQLQPGGAMIIVDKESRALGYLDAVLKRVTLASKVKAGATLEHVMAKELSLAGIQRPVTATELPASATEWFRFGEFTGWVIERHSPTLSPETKE